MFYGEALEAQLQMERIEKKIIEGNIHAAHNCKHEFDMIETGYTYAPGDCLCLSLATTFWWNRQTREAVKNIATSYPSDIAFSRDLLYCDFGFCHFANEDRWLLWGYVNDYDTGIPTLRVTHYAKENGILSMHWYALVCIAAR